MAKLTMPLHSGELEKDQQDITILLRYHRARLSLAYTRFLHSQRNYFQTTLPTFGQAISAEYSRLWWGVNARCSAAKTARYINHNTTWKNAQRHGGFT